MPKGARGTHPADEEILRGFGAALAELRVERGIAQTELARRAHLSQSTISYLELGRRSPSLSVLLSLAHALDIPPGHLVAAATTTPEETHP